jgi:hypothetical protein
MAKTCRRTQLELDVRHGAGWLACGGQSLDRQRTRDRGKAREC